MTSWEAGSSGLLPNLLYATAAPTETLPAPARPPASERIEELSAACTLMVPLLAVTVALVICASTVLRIQFSVIEPVTATLPDPAPVMAKDQSCASTLAPPFVPSVEALDEMSSQLVPVLGLASLISALLPVMAARTVTLPLSLVTVPPSTQARRSEWMSLVATATPTATLPAPAPAPAMTTTVGSISARTTTSPAACNVAPLRASAITW